jgi:predicted ATPase
LRVAAGVKDRFADGVWYVDLVPVTDAVMTAPAVARALGLGEHPGSSAADDVVNWLADREALLVLDNCEHLLDGVVVLLERLLAGSPRSAVLATSRARLLVPFEWVFPVPGLSVEADDGGPGDAVALFLGRAAAGGRVVGAADVERIAAVCKALDGMALAIELAAARYASLGLDGLEAGLSDRLRLLTGGRRIDDRHRSLRSALDWSYALLDEPHRAVLRRVSVFAEPFTATAAATVVKDWPGWPTIACCSLSLSRVEPATAPRRPSASTVPTGSRRQANWSRPGHVTSRGAYGKVPLSSSRRTRLPVAGVRRSTRSPMSYAARCPGPRKLSNFGPRRTDWQ